MDVVDQDLERAERGASPERFPSPSRRRPSTEIKDDAITGASADRNEKEKLTHKGNPGTTAVEEEEAEERRPASSSSSSSASSVLAPVNGDDRDRMSRINTERDLERGPTHADDPVSISRIATQRSQHQGTIGAAARSRTRDSRKPLPAFGGGKPYPPVLPEQEDYVVEFDGPGDPLHPQNWPMKKKVALGAMLGYTTLVAVFASSIFSTATMAIAAEFGVSTEVGTLGVSLFVLGFAFGPLIWGPLSELRGRRLPLLIAMFGFTLFQIAAGTGKDLQTIFLSRFFGGAFASCPLAVVAAVFSDMFDNRTRGLAVTVFSTMVFGGPLMAPFIGGFIVENSTLGWRWTEYLCTILGGVAFLLDLFFLPESYPPVVLVEKASELRRRTKNWGIHAKQEEIEVDFRELVSKNFSRPLRILVGEPIVLLLSIYMAFIYGLLYLSLTSYPIVFVRIHGMSLGVGGLPYFGMIVGQLSAGVLMILQQPSYNKKLAANGGMPIPEWRLPPVIIGGAAFSIGLFWFGWTGYREDIHWIAPTLSGLLTGFGLLAIFLQSLNYIIDAYLMFAASAIAANTLLRSLFGAIFPLFAQYMYNSLGVNWSGTLLGCVAAILVPIPILFLKYGAKIREKSKFAPTFPPKGQAAGASKEE